MPCHCARLFFKYKRAGEVGNMLQPLALLVLNLPCCTLPMVPLQGTMQCETGLSGGEGAYGVGVLSEAPPLPLYTCRVDEHPGGPAMHMMPAACEAIPAVLSYMPAPLIG